MELEDWEVGSGLYSQGTNIFWDPRGPAASTCGRGLELKPYFLGGTGVQSDRREMPEEMPIHLEAGTGNEPSYHGLLAALRWGRKTSTGAGGRRGTAPVSERGTEAAWAALS